MKAPFDLTKLRKDVVKSIPGMSQGFHDPTTFLDTGCFALNYIISNRFNGGVPLEGKTFMFAGDSGSGKSYIVSANLVKDCQRKGIFPIVIDTENALDEEWLKNLGVDTSEDKFLKWTCATVDDCAKFIGKLIDNYRSDNDSLPYEQRAKICVIIDSIGMLVTPTQQAQFEEGDMKGDMGIKAKQITHMVRVLLAKIASQPIGIGFTNHTYQAQDKYSPDNISGGKMLEFATSIIVQMNKLLLKEDEFGNKLEGGKVAGIRASVTTRKSRYAKPFEKLKIDIPYETGMDPYSGLFELFEGKGLLVKEGISYVYTSRDTGEIHKHKRKQLKESGVYDLIMAEHALWDTEGDAGFDLTGAEEEE